MAFQGLGPVCSPASAPACPGAPLGYSSCPRVEQCHPLPDGLGSKHLLLQPCSPSPRAAAVTFSPGCRGPTSSPASGAQPEACFGRPRLLVNLISDGEAVLSPASPDCMDCPFHETMDTFRPKSCFQLLKNGAVCLCL